MVGDVGGSEERSLSRHVFGWFMVLLYSAARAHRAFSPGPYCSTYAHLQDGTNTFDTRPNASVQEQQGEAPPSLVSLSNYCDIVRAVHGEGQQPEFKESFRLERIVACAHQQCKME